MTILSLEFSSAIRSVAVWPAGSSSEAQVQLSTSDERGFRIHPVTLIDSALRKAQVDRRQVELIAVGLGPGSYTGIRSAIAVLQGWSIGSSIKVSGVSSADAIAEQALKEGVRGVFHTIIDAQRDEFYVADYESDGTGLNVRKELRIHTRAEIAGLEAPLFGPSLPAFGLTGLEIIPQAKMIGVIAARGQHTSTVSDIIPIYLRETAFVKAPPPRILPTA